MLPEEKIEHRFAVIEQQLSSIAGKHDAIRDDFKAFREANNENIRGVLEDKIDKFIRNQRIIEGVIVVIFMFFFITVIIKGNDILANYVTRYVKEHTEVFLMQNHISSRESFSVYKAISAYTKLANDDIGIKVEKISYINQLTDDTKNGRDIVNSIINDSAPIFGSFFDILKADLINTQKIRRVGDEALWIVYKFIKYGPPNVVKRCKIELNAKAKDDKTLVNVLLDMSLDSGADRNKIDEVRKAYNELLP